ncbi:MAG: Ig-like domain-containing protein [Planctomycetaceae bacterium]|jgi:hypothetical protein|nr:Ig-like domain-containing protein [Planctomycetaceae bacterium]
MKINITKIILAVIFSLFTICNLVGCGSELSRKYAELNLATVTGIITFDGRPLENAQIQFVQNDGFFSYGVTDSNGHYQMQFDSKHKGVKAGKHTVKIWMTMSGPGFEQLLPDNFKKNDNEIIPIQYNHDSILSADVEAGKTQSFDFDLKSGGKTKKAISPEGDVENTE